MTPEETRQHLERCLSSYQSNKNLDEQQLIDILNNFAENIKEVDEQYYSIVQGVITEAKKITDEKIATIKANGQRRTNILVRWSITLLALWLSIQGLNSFVIIPIRRHFCQLSYYQPRTYTEKNPCQEIT